MTPLARDLAARGFAAWNIEYRRVGQEGGGWPGTLEDVAAAADAVPGLDGVDPSRVVTVGHSAGGHLALWLAARHRIAAGAPGAEPRLRPFAPSRRPASRSRRVGPRRVSAGVRARRCSAASRTRSQSAMPPPPRLRCCRSAFRSCSSTGRGTTSCRRSRAAPTQRSESGGRRGRSRRASQSRPLRRHRGDGSRRLELPSLAARAFLLSQATSRVALRRKAGNVMGRQAERLALLDREADPADGLHLDGPTTECPGRRRVSAAGVVGFDDGSSHATSHLTCRRARGASLCNC